VAPVPFVDCIVFSVTSPRTGSDKGFDLVDIARGCFSTEIGAGGSGSTLGVGKLFEDGPRVGRLTNKVPDVVAVGIDELQLID
jgi:hypothetical protein